MQLEQFGLLQSQRRLIIRSPWRPAAARGWRTEPPVELFGRLTPESSRPPAGCSGHQSKLLSFSTQLISQLRISHFARFLTFHLPFLHHFRLGLIQWRSGRLGLEPRW